MRLPANEVHTQTQVLDDPHESAEVTSAARSRITELLQKPFDVRSVALTGLFILAILYTMYFTRSVIILLSLTFWGWMWGIVGVILAVPILAAFKIFCAHIKPMEPIAEFLS